MTKKIDIQKVQKATRGTIQVDKKLLRRLKASANEQGTTMLDLAHSILDRGLPHHSRLA